MSIGQKIKNGMKYLGMKIQDNKGKIILGIGAAGIGGSLGVSPSGWLAVCIHAPRRE